MSNEQHLARNRAHWDEVVAIHARSDFYDVPAFEAGADTLKPPELEALGDVGGTRVLHLQCHFGLDTLSLARRGAIVTGVDFSSAAIDKARELAQRIGVEARFVCANVLELGEQIDEQFDIVFSSWGVLGWLPDLRRWADVAAARLRPAGRLCLAEFHPIAQVFDEAESDPARLQIKWRYFHDPEPDVEMEDGSYADRDATVTNKTTAWWCHSVGDVVSAVVAAGLQVDGLRELPRCWYPVFPILEPDGEGAYRLRGGIDGIPLSYVLTAHAPSQQVARETGPHHQTRSDAD